MHGSRNLVTYVSCSSVRLSPMRALRGPQTPVRRIPAPTPPVNKEYRPRSAGSSDAPNLCAGEREKTQQGTAARDLAGLCLAVQVDLPMMSSTASKSPAGGPDASASERSGLLHGVAAYVVDKSDEGHPGYNRRLAGTAHGRDMLQRYDALALQFGVRILHTVHSRAAHTADAFVRPLGARASWRSVTLPQQVKASVSVRAA